jgi:hypothetical protein
MRAPETQQPVPGENRLREMKEDSDAPSYRDRLAEIKPAVMARIPMKEI